MGSAYFYHLTRDTLQSALPRLIGSARKAGWRVLVRGTSDPVMRRLDEQLWADPADSFLPHGLAGGPMDAAQPVLLGTGAAGDVAANDAQCLMTVQGATLDAAEVARYRRCCIIFDGADPAAVQFARGQWKDLTAAGAAAQYWSQESGRWERKAQTGSEPGTGNRPGQGAG
ncbi:DNA polymerase III subunit chi [Brevirhabdus sp.]|uniref:DNA polymerase III subunit chi n=1 Tax=Brevirhabdus sp. TaxID=2004514 RepID=UPI0040589AD0